MPQLDRLWRRTKIACDFYTVDLPANGPNANPDQIGIIQKLFDLFNTQSQHGSNLLFV